MPDIRLRFVRRRSSWISSLISLEERFWATHVEAVMPDGQYLGAHISGGVRIRPANYDAGKWEKQLFVDLPATQAQYDAHFNYLHRRLKTPYDWMAVLGFVIHYDFHTPHHMICSALIHMSLRQPEAPWFPYPLAIPAHETSPAILAMVLSGIVLIGDPEIRKGT